MNILILSWRGPEHPNAGGAEQSTLEHAKGWVKAGHNITLFTSFFKGCKEFDLIDGIKIIRRGRQMFGVQWEAFKWYLFGKHPKFDLIIDQFHGIPFFTPIYIKERKLAFIHEATKEVWGLNPWPKPFNLFPAILGRLAEPLIFKFFYQKIPFMTVSDSTKIDLIDWGIPKENITVIHNGVSIPKKINHPPKEKDPTVIFLGAISKDKGIEDALEVFSILNKANKNFKFWVVGNAGINYITELRSLTHKLNIDKKTIFYGFVSEEKKFHLLAKAHIMINTSAREGWGLVVIEGAYVGTPTVGYNVVGLRDSIVDNKTGILCDPNPEACAQQILNLLNNLTKYNNLQKNCKTWSKKFNWDKSSRKSLALIERIINI